MAQVDTPFDFIDWFRQGGKWITPDGRLTEEAINQLENIASFNDQIYERTGGSDDAILEIQLGELYESGLSQFDPSELQGGDDTALSDLHERVEDLESQMPSLATQLLERVQDLEVDSAGSFPTVSEEKNIIDVAADHTTAGDEIINCVNSSSIAITLNALPDDGEAVEIKRWDALVSLTGTIDGSTTSTLSVKYDAIRLRYSANQAQWGVF